MSTFFDSLDGKASKGPIHTFNGHKANFYRAYQDSCSLISGRYSWRTDANYFCRSFYGREYVASSWRRGHYSDMSNSPFAILGWQMNRGRNYCMSGETISGTNCNGYPCEISQNTNNYDGIYDIVCAKLKPGMCCLRNVLISDYIVYFISR